MFFQLDTKYGVSFKQFLKLLSSSYADYFFCLTIASRGVRRTEMETEAKEKKTFDEIKPAMRSIWEVKGKNGQLTPEQKKEIQEDVSNMRNDRFNRIANRVFGLDKH